MSYINRPPPVNGNINTWGERLNDWLVRNRSKLAYYIAGQPATEDGMLLWDAANSRILVSVNNAWVEVGAGGGGGSITNYLRDDADDSTAFRLTMGGLTVDTDTLYVDSVENEVGIGTINPSEKLEVVGNVEATEFIGDLRGAVVFKAQAGEALTKGDVVYISGISGNTTVVSKADADDAAKMPAFGLAAADANNNASVEVYTFGTLAGLDTSSYTEGNELFVGTTAGALVSTAPTGESSSVQKICKVTRSHASSGSVKIMGAGRTNATPNLNNGNIFIGDSNNQAVTTSLATQVSALETSHNDVLVDGDFTSNGFMKRTGAGTYAIDSSTYLTSFDITTQTDPKYLRADADDTTTGTITAPNVDISTTGSVTTNIATGGNNGNTTDVKVVNIGTGYGSGFFAGLSTTINMGSQSSSAKNIFNIGNGTTSGTGENTINLKGNVTVSGTVDGVDVGNLKYHSEEFIGLREGSNRSLTTTYQDVGCFTNIYDRATPMDTMRIVNINTEIFYSYTSSTNDVQFQLSLVVPETANAVSLGNVTQVFGGEYATISAYEEWYYVSGDKTHLFTDYGKIHENSSGGSNLRTLYSYQYNPSLDRTYFLISTYPAQYSNGTELFWHPYAWQNAGTVLVYNMYNDERYHGGQQSVSFMVKTAYSDQAITYRLKARELGTSDIAQISRSEMKISRQEV